MFDWLGDIFSGIGNLLGDALASLGESISNSIFDAILRWWYEMIYNAVADFFSQMSGMGAEIFELAWCRQPFACSRCSVGRFMLSDWSLLCSTWPLSTKMAGPTSSYLESTS